MAESSTAVLMMGYGGPTSLAEVRPFVENIAHGRNITQERIDAVVEQYRVIGGKSPFNELTKLQADALAARLQADGHNLDVKTGMLFWPPYIKDTIESLLASGTKRAVGIIMAPHRTEASFDRYIRAAEEAGSKNGDFKVEFVDGWHTHPLFIEAITDRVNAALDTLPFPKRQTQIIFSAHSVPTDMSDASGYARQIEETARLVADKLDCDRWKVAYQSRSGSPKQSWLEPDVRDVIIEVGTYGYQQVCVVPIGFVCDHVEVLFDLDVQAAAVAKEWHTRMARAGTVGDHPRFIQMLAELVKAKL